MIGSSTADEKCGWSERYQVYLKKNVYWPDIPDYIDYSLNLAKQSVPHQLMGYNDYKMESAVGWQKAKSDQVYQLMKSLIALNCSIDYVATQTHIKLEYVNYTDGNYNDYAVQE